MAWETAWGGGPRSTRGGGTEMVPPCPAPGAGCALPWGQGPPSRNRGQQTPGLAEHYGKYPQLSCPGLGGPRARTSFLLHGFQAHPLATPLGPGSTWHFPAERTPGRQLKPSGLPMAVATASVPGWTCLTRGAAEGLGARRADVSTDSAPALCFQTNTQPSFQLNYQKHLRFLTDPTTELEGEVS